MSSTIQKWGNSLSVRLPKSILEASMMAEHDTVTFKARKGEIIINKVGHRHMTLKERLAKADSADEDHSFTEWDTGKPLGREVL